MGLFQLGEGIIRLALQHTGGNVGIGTTSPGSTLHILGGLEISNSTYYPNAFKFFQDSTGNLEINYMATSEPSSFQHR